MTNERYQAIKSIFIEVRDLTTFDRTACLDRLCKGDEELRQEVLRLLNAHDQADDPVSQALDAADAPMPSQIERYRVLGVLGVGGMGVVYRAEQESPRRTVALKVVRPGLMSRQLLRRFEYEAQVLGRLHHPGIAQIFEAGTTQTERGYQPFFAMELVEGEPIVQHCRERHLGTRDRLALLVKVSQAVEHAHQKGVVHRDIKPGNILVDAAGQPKILDFGVARLTDRDVNVTTISTNVGQLMGTVPYMSPEQVSGGISDVDTRSDVYALGVLMYEMLAGRNPHDLAGTSLAEAARIISDVEPLPMSSISPVFRGDLDTIVAKAMAKSREMRYQTASAFAGDLERFLRDEPITARPPGTVYLMRKFASRNKGLVAGLSAAFVILIAGIIGISILAYSLNESQVRVSAEAEQARIKASTATRVQTLLTEIFSRADRRNFPGPEITLRQVLDEGVANIKTGLSEEPLVAAELMRTISVVYRSLGEYDLAVSLARESLSLYVNALGERCEDVAETRAVLASALHSAGQAPEDIEQYRASLALWEELAGHDSEAVAKVLNDLAVALCSQGEYDQAIQLSTEALAIYRRLGTAAPEDIAFVTSNLADTYSWKGDSEKAGSLLKEVLSTLEGVYPDGHPRIANALNSLGGVYMELGDLDRAEEVLQRSLEMRRRLVGANDPYLLHTKSNLAWVWSTKGQNQRAADMMDEVLTARLDLYKADHMDLALAMNNLGTYRRDLGQLEEAERLLRDSVAMRTRLVEKGSIPKSKITPAMNNLADVLERRENDDEAESLYRESLAIRQQEDAGGLDTAISLHNLGGFLCRHGRYEEGRPLLEGALAIRQRMLPATHFSIANTLTALSDMYREQRDYESALPLITEALDVYKAGLPEGHSKITNVHAKLAQMFEQMGVKEQALENFRVVLKRVQQYESKKADRVITARSDVARLLIACGKTEEARNLLSVNVETALEVHDRPKLISQAAGEFAAFLQPSQEYAECERVLTSAYESIVGLETTHDHDTTEASRAIVNALIDLYSTWDGHEEQAARWQDVLSAIPDFEAATSDGR